MFDWQSRLYLLIITCSILPLSAGENEKGAIDYNGGFNQSLTKRTDSTRENNEALPYWPTISQ